MPECIFPSIFQHTPDLSQPFMKDRILFIWGWVWGCLGYAKHGYVGVLLEYIKTYEQILIVGVNRPLFPGSFNSSPLKNYNPKKKGLSSNYRIQLEPPKET